LSIFLHNGNPGLPGLQLAHAGSFGFCGLGQDLHLGHIDLHSGIHTLHAGGQGKVGLGGGVGLKLYGGGTSNLGIIGFWSGKLGSVLFSAGGGTTGTAIIVSDSSCGVSSGIIGGFSYVKDILVSFLGGSIDI
jgi:hypothetical protein